MRSKHLLLFFAVLVTGGFTAMKTVTSNQSQLSAVESVDELEQSRVAEMDKGEGFNTSDLQAVRLKLKEALSSHGNGTLNWQILGPNNVAGRVRGIVIDRQDPRVMYAGSASGGIYKTETNGQYWFPIPTDYYAGVISVTSMTQGPDNTIYATTGETFDSFKIGINDTKSFAGVGVFYLPPGATKFKHLASTDPINNEDFFGIIELAVDPTNSKKLYMTTWKGAYQSVDAGVSWNLIDGLPKGYATGVQVSEKGTVIISVDSKVFVNNGSGFVQVSGTDDKMIDAGGIRFKFAFAPSNPDYVYAVGADSVGKLLGIYRSVEKGAPNTWETIGLGGSDGFAIFTRVHKVRSENVKEYEGNVSMAIHVSLDDENYIYVGGMDLWTGYKVSNVEPFQWMRKTYNNIPKYLPLYLTSNIHEIVEHSNGSFFIATDGGVFRFNSETNSVKVSAYLNTTQAHSVAFGPKGEVAMGLEDNGVWYNNLLGNESQMLSAYEIIRREDFDAGATHGFQTLISQVAPELIFYEHSNGRIFKTYDFGESVVAPYSSEVLFSYSKYQAWDTRNSQMAIWESCDYPYGHDTYKYRTYKDLNPGDVDTIDSYNISRAPIYNKITKHYDEDDSVEFQDPYKQILAFGAQGRLWLTRTAGSIQPDKKYNWIDVFSIYNYYGKPPYYNPISYSKLTSDITSVVFSQDGHHIYIAASYKNDSIHRYEIFRLDSIHTFFNNFKTSWEVATSPSYTVSADTLLSHTQKMGEVDREITSLSIDPNNKSTLIVTLGGYNNEDKVYVCPVANTSSDESFENNFYSIQGNLPRIPAYTAVIDVTKGKKLIVGTEVGIWTTPNYLKPTAKWTYDSKGVGPIPVTQIKQQQLSMEEFPKIENYGNIYISTYGGGLFVDSSSYKARPKSEVVPSETPVSTSDLDVNVYPNPVDNNLSLNITSISEGDVIVDIYNIAGQPVYSENIGSITEEKKYSIDVSGLDKGVYYTKVSTGNQHDVVKFVKK